MPAYVVNAEKAEAKLQALQERTKLAKQEAVLKALPTPCYVVDEARIIKNLELLRHVPQEAGCHILLAQNASPCSDFIP